MIELKTTHPGVRKVHVWGGGAKRNGQDNISILFSNGHEEQISSRWGENPSGVDYLIEKATEYVNSLNGGNPELTEEELKYASPEDIEFFNRITEGLPTMAGRNGDGFDKFGQPIPYHSGSHILRHFRDTLEIVKPKTILEIGFNMGHSASMWLNLTDYHLGVISLDISEKEETLNGAAILENRYPSRFSYINRNSDRFQQLYDSWLELNNYHFDLCFIDGAHDEGSIFQDIVMCEKLKIPYLLFDDWYPRYGETQKAVAQFPELELIKDMNNLRLYKVNYGSSS